MRETQRALVALAGLMIVAGKGRLDAQNPLSHWTDAIGARFTVRQPVLSYRLSVDTADLSGFDVAITVRNAPDTVLLAMAAHPEYDDRYWRYVRDVRAESERGRAIVSKVEDPLWRVVAPGGAFTVRYRLVLPPPDPRFRAGWQPFLASTGGLVGGIHSFMYVVGETLAPAHVGVDLPVGWTIATALEATSDPRTFYAPSASVLVESPMLVGRLREWRFAVDDVPHRVVYWPRPDAVAFDTVALVDGIERIVRGGVSLFGRAPYREYVFLLHDGALGALEHPSSMALGAPSRNLAEGLGPLFAELSHEYVHAWNLMRIRPVEYGDVSYRTPPRSRGLWFSEGLSIFYADLLRRRAGLAVDTPDRRGHVRQLIARYLSIPGNARLSAERVSLAEYADGPGALGDYTGSSHVQGEVIGTMLDLQIRHATAGRRSMDDVMRLMLERHAGARGFTTADVERAVADTCRCSVKTFFDAHVRGGGPIPFDRYLGYMGLRAQVTWRPALGADNQPVPDLRAYPYDPGDGSGPRLGLQTPESAWGRAGLHTGDHVRAVNGARTPTAESLRLALRGLRSGDTVRVEIERGGTPRTVSVVMAPFERPFVEIHTLPNATAAQLALRARWESGAP
jgi:predicted metalloprotease with PDZ domain